MKASNAALDSRRWHQPKAERDDLPLFDVTHHAIVVVVEHSTSTGRSQTSERSTCQDHLGIKRMDSQQMRSEETV
jgi:hypothetical protein